MSTPCLRFIVMASRPISTWLSVLTFAAISVHVRPGSAEVSTFPTPDLTAAPYRRPVIVSLAYLYTHSASSGRHHGAYWA
jgi:hypothetical protein